VQHRQMSGQTRVPTTAQLDRGARCLPVIASDVSGGAPGVQHLVHARLPSQGFSISLSGSKSLVSRRPVDNPLCDLIKSLVHANVNRTKRYRAGTLLNVGATDALKPFDHIRPEGLSGRATSEPVREKSVNLCPVAQPQFHERDAAPLNALAQHRL